jgi:hypothetical protein
MGSIKTIDRTPGLKALVFCYVGFKKRKAIIKTGPY